MLLLVGGFLLSHTLPGAVPLALAGLASGFGMGPGVSPPLLTTGTGFGARTHGWCVGVVVCQILDKWTRAYTRVWCVGLVVFVRWISTGRLLTLLCL